jgi:iron-sulfur cluster assembly protein
MQNYISVNITPTARERLAEAIKKFGTPSSYIRIEAMEGGGCSCGCGGVAYSMMIEDKPTEQDVVQEVGGVRLVTSKESLPLLEGTVIDYYDGVESSGFVINNPNVETPSCGCGGHH